MNDYECQITKVVDGDTVDCLINLGFNVIIRQRVRMYGINTPESRTRDPEEKKLGLAAKARLEELFTEGQNHAVLKSYGVGKFGRCLGEFFVNGNQLSVNQILIQEGHGKEYYGGKR